MNALHPLTVHDRDDAAIATTLDALDRAIVTIERTGTTWSDQVSVIRKATEIREHVDNVFGYSLSDGTRVCLTIQTHQDLHDPRRVVRDTCLSQVLRMRDIVRWVAAAPIAAPPVPMDPREAMIAGHALHLAAIADDRPMPELDGLLSQVHVISRTPLGTGGVHLAFEDHDGSRRDSTSSPDEREAPLGPIETVVCRRDGRDGSKTLVMTIAAFTQSVTIPAMDMLDRLRLEASLARDRQAA